MAGVARDSPWTPHSTRPEALWQFRFRADVVRAGPVVHRAEGRH